MSSNVTFPHVIKLEEPVEAHGEEIKQLTIRKPKGKDLMSLPLTIEGTALTLPTRELASALAEVPPSTIDDLCAEDAIKVMVVVNPFVTPLLETL